MSKKYKTRLAKGEKVVCEENVTKMLKAAGSDKILVPQVTSMIALYYKAGAREVNARLFPINTGKYNKSIYYKGGPKARNKYLKGGQLSSIYEYNGAVINPKEKAALSSINNPYSKTSFITRGEIVIQPRPWFFDTVRKMRDSGVGEEATLQAIRENMYKKALDD